MVVSGGWGVGPMMELYNTMPQWIKYSPLVELFFLVTLPSIPLYELSHRVSAQS